MSMNQMKTLLSCNIAPRASVLARMVMGLIGIAAASAWAQQSPSVKTGCNGQLSAEMTKIAAPYQKVAEAFKSTEKGWCALAVEVQKDDYISEPAALPMAWEFVSAAYVLHPAWNRKSWTAAQQNAMRELAQQISGADIPLRKGAFYVLASDAICLTPCIQKCVHKSRAERWRVISDAAPIAPAK